MKGLSLSSLDFELPQDLIALKPVEPRDSCRLMVLDRMGGKIHHGKFWDLESFLLPGDVLVLNASKVLPSRLWGRSKTGRTFEVLVIEESLPPKLYALVRPARKVVLGEELEIAPEVRFVPMASYGNGIFEGAFEGPEGFLDWRRVAQEKGQVPLPPYIAKKLPMGHLLESEKWLKVYNSVYAKTPGSVAAPTAGLHFSLELLEALSRKGVEVLKLELKVGMGTFKPLKLDRVEDNWLEPEAFNLDGATLRALAEAKKQGRRLVAVGTTVVRALESVWPFVGDPGFQARGLFGYTNKFIFPGYRFQAVDGLVTNFHLPCSSLLALVSAFAGLEPILKAYQEAIALGYRFYSFGDAMVIIPSS